MDEWLEKASEDGRLYISMPQKIDWCPVRELTMYANGTIAFRYENGHEIILTNLSTITIKVVDKS